MRPAVALISNGYAPYRERLLRRLAVELPEIELCNLYTHEESNAPWRFQARTETRPVLFGPGESAAAGRSPRNALHEWKKGGRILQWMDEHAVRGVVLYGYDDPGRLRVLHGAVRRGIPAFLGADSNIRNPAPSPMRALVKKIYVRHVVRRCAGILVFGELGRQYFQAYGAPSERIHLVPFEPDYGLLAKQPQGPVASAAKWIRPGMRHLLYAGRLAEVKRPDLLLQAFAGIAAQRPQWRLVIAGEGPMRRSLQEGLDRSLADRVVWTGFIEDETVLASLFRQTDAFVLPSSEEPWAVALTEAAAAGLAIVASDIVGSAFELVRSGENGYVFPSGDGRALQDALLRVTDPALIDGFKARSTALSVAWRRASDPVEGFRAALGSVGLL